EYIQSQEPIDFAHWLLLVGALLCLSINYILSDNAFSTLASILTSLGVVALIGQATIDFIWWSYGDDHIGMTHLTSQIMGRPSIRIPFMTIGPALFYLGLATHAGKRIRKNPIWSLATLIGVILTGLGSFAYHNRMLIVLGHIILTIGIIALLLKRTTKR
ncbi:MAG: hypothetical protein AAFO99_13535, partial [Bacteroidota bacterium]